MRKINNSVELKKMIGIHLPHDLLGLLNQLATKEERSLSNLVRKIIKDYFKKQPK